MRSLNQHSHHCSKSCTTTRTCLKSPPQSTTIPKGWSMSRISCREWSTASMYSGICLRVWGLSASKCHYLGDKQHQAGLAVLYTNLCWDLCRHAGITPERQDHWTGTHIWIIPIDRFHCNTYLHGSLIANNCNRPLERFCVEAIFRYVAMVVLYWAQSPTGRGSWKFVRSRAACRRSASSHRLGHQLVHESGVSFALYTASHH